MKEIIINKTKCGKILNVKESLMVDDYEDSIFLLLLDFACKYNYNEEELQEFCDKQIYNIFEEMKR